MTAKRGPGRPVTDLSAKGERARARRRNLVKRRVCLRCGGRSAPDRVLCRKCHSIAMENQAMMRTAKREAGLCQECGAESGGKSRCQRCAELRNARPSRTTKHREAEHARTAELRKQRSRRWRSLGLCSECGAKRSTVKKSALCEPHRAKQAATWQARRR